MNDYAPRAQPVHPETPWQTQAQVDQENVQIEAYRSAAISDYFKARSRTVIPGQPYDLQNAPRTELVQPQASPDSTPRWHPQAWSTPSPSPDYAERSLKYLDDFLNGKASTSVPAAPVAGDGNATTSPLPFLFIFIVSWFVILQIHRKYFPTGPKPKTKPRPTPEPSLARAIICRALYWVLMVVMAYGLLFNSTPIKSNGIWFVVALILVKWLRFTWTRSRAKEKHRSRPKG